MTDTVSTTSVPFNLAEYHVEEVKKSLNSVEKITDRAYKIKEMMSVSLRVERAIMKLKELQSEMATEISKI